MQVLVPVVYRMLTIFATLILQNVFLLAKNEGNVGLVGWKIWKCQEKSVTLCPNGCDCRLGCTSAIKQAYCVVLRILRTRLTVSRLAKASSVWTTVAVAKCRLCSNGWVGLGRFEKGFRICVLRRLYIWLVMRDE